MPKAEPHSPSYDELARLVAAQAVRIAELEAELAELKRRLGTNSSNSSKPPSQDGLAKSKRSSGSSGGKRGKPFGAPGVTMRLVDDPDSTIECPPVACGACQKGLSGASEFSRQRRQVVELPPPPKAKVTEFQLVVQPAGSVDVTLVDHAGSPCWIMVRAKETMTTRAV